LFFDNTVCVKCGCDTGICPECQRVSPLLPAEGGGLRCGNPDCAAELRKCANCVENGCNFCVLAVDATDGTMCEYCALTTVIPDLNIDHNRDRWRRLARAKRRVLYTLDRIGYQFRADNPNVRTPLSFEFKADEKEPVRTGHDNGRITINIREADDVEREKARIAFDEPKRTLVEHFRHELGHYFWDNLVQDQCEADFRAVFGDERSPSYADALSHYHANGPAPNWRDSHVSGYATMHPWEDFAETFRTYLDMVSILDTARHFSTVTGEWSDVDEMVASYQQVGMFANELNRDMGLLDLVPEIFVPAVVDKLRFIAALPRRTEMS